MSNKRYFFSILLIFSNLICFSQNKLFDDTISFNDVILKATKTEKPIFFYKQIYNPKHWSPLSNDWIEKNFNHANLLDSCINFRIDNDTIKLKQVPKQVLELFNSATIYQKLQFIILDAKFNLIYKPELVYDSGRYIEYKELFEKPELLSEAISIKKSYNEFLIEFQPKNISYLFLKTFLKKCYFVKDFSKTTQILNSFVDCKDNLDANDYIWIFRNIKFLNSFENVLNSKSFNLLYDYLKKQNFNQIQIERDENLNELNSIYKEYFDKIMLSIYKNEDTKLKKLFDKYKDATPYTKEKKIIFEKSKNNKESIPPPPKY